MREYLFRGKRNDNGEWVEGSLVTKVDPLLETNYCFILAQGRGESFVTWHMVDPATVGQFTGLMDKNGKRIFEGHKLEVVRNETKWVCTVDDIRNMPWALFGSSVKSVEIIGNIHDNPELVEGMI